MVTRAERNPEVERLPFRALFAAYDAAVVEHGVNPDEGQAYMRFLFKMGSKGRQGESLLDRFNNMLHELGIVVELVDDGDDVDDTDINVTRDRHSPEDSALDNNWHGTNGSNVNHVINHEPLSRNDDTAHEFPRRRASFNSMYDVGNDGTQRSIPNRPSSRSSLSRLQVGKPEFLGNNGLSGRDRNKRSKSPDRTQLLAQFLEAGRLLMDRLRSSKREKRKPAETSHLPNGHLSATDIEQNKLARDLSSRKTHETGSSSSLDEFDEASIPGGETGETEDDDIGKREVPPEMLYRPSLSDLLRDASTFNMYRQRAISRRILTQWLKKAVQTQQGHRNTEVVAFNRDRITLLRQAFDTWRTICIERRQEVQTERFFRHLEERVARARDLYLLTKAFTHWAQVTTDEVAKTSAARQHILGVKYFKAWREITAVNEMKSQRFTLRRPFLAWRRKVHQVRASEADAVATHDRNLVRSTYWQWFWDFCDRRAPQWYQWCLKRRSLIFWLRGFRTNRERAQDIDFVNKREGLGSALRNWLYKSKAVASAEQEADSLHRQSLLRGTLDEWRIQSRLNPAYSQVSSRVDDRVLRTALGQWVSRARNLKQARKIDRHRLLRNSWTTWNDLLRCQALNARIEERLKLETMYKWILAERFHLMRRIRDRRVTREVFSKFVTNTRGTYSRLLCQADIHENRRDTDLLRSKLVSWRDRLALQRQREDAAFEFYASRLEQESVAVWLSKHQHVAKLEGRSHDAHFYFLAAGSLKRLRTAKSESAKRRRQEAYATIRRKSKVNLVTVCLLNWRERSQHILSMEQQALQFHRIGSLRIASELLSRLHEETAKKVQLIRDGDAYYSRQVVYDLLTRWTEKHFQNRNMEDHSNHLYDLRVLSQAGAQLRKLSLRVFQMKSSAETADSLRGRNVRKHSRSLIRHWAEKARMAVAERGSPGPAVTPTSAPGIPSLDGINHPNLPPPYQIETPFKLSEIFSSSPSPQTRPLETPITLTSPSKQATRARTLAQVSTTPSTPLYTPFAGRLLRAGMGTGTGTAAPSARGRRIKRSPPGTSVRFVDEEPESPTESRRSANKKT